MPKSLLDESIREGRMPFLARLLSSGAYNLASAFWGSPPSTPCFQAGLLYGLRHPNLPAYQWFDRELGRELKMSTPEDALLVEQRLGRSASSSLLSNGGTTYLSLFRGQAENQICMSGLSDFAAQARTIPAVFAGLTGAQRRSLLTYARHTVCDLAKTAIDVSSWVRRVKDNRHERKYLISRFFLTQLAWDLARTRAVVDMISGVPVIYLVFANFDEVAHRRGPFSAQARAELYRVDAQLEELYAVATELEAPYDLYLLSDHGHVDCSPFERRAGQRLEESLLSGASPPLSAGVERALLDGRILSAHPHAGPSDAPVVIESGNFSHVYLSRGATPLEAADLVGRHRNVLARAVEHRDIGVVALRRGNSAVAIIQGEVYAPAELSRAPLASEFSKPALADFLRELQLMPTAGDLVLFGERVSATGTVGFAWEFGSHGGITRIETDSAIGWPSQGPLDLGSLSHSVQLHDKLSEAYRS